MKSDQKIPKPAPAQTINDSAAVPKTISDVLKVDPVLPGEPVEDYRQGLQDLIAELGAKTILQIYIAEKIYDCFWWLRRYENQKRSTIIAEMAAQIEKGFSTNLTQKQIDFREYLLSNKVTDQAVKLAASVGHTMESLRQSAISRRRGELMQLDNQILLQTRILAGLQSSYEVAFNRKRHAEHLDLQNALIRKDIGAIDGEVVHDQPKAKSRKPD